MNVGQAGSIERQSSFRCQRMPGKQITKGGKQVDRFGMIATAQRRARLVIKRLGGAGMGGPYLSKLRKRLCRRLIQAARVSLECLRERRLCVHRPILSV